MKNGGARPGAGRKKGGKASHTLEAQEARAWFVQKVHENLQPIFVALMTKAVEGDVGALRELLDRGFGKAAQSIDVTSKDERTKPLSESAAKLVEELETKLSKSISE